jgi:hypothetical protein
MHRRGASFDQAQGGRYESVRGELVEPYDLCVSVVKYGSSSFWLPGYVLIAYASLAIQVKAC